MAGRSENSGLIDLDALMREASAKEAAGAPLPPPAVEVAPTPTPAPVAANPIPAPPKQRAEAPVAAKAIPAPPKHLAETPVVAKAIPAPRKELAETPVAAKAVAVKAVAAPVKEAPAAPSKSRSTDDSLEAVTTEASSEPRIVATPSVPPKSVPPRHAPAASRARRPAIGIALALAMLAGGAVLLKSRVTSVGSQPQGSSVAAVDLAPRPEAANANANANAQPSEAPTTAALNANDLPPATAPSASARSARAAPQDRRSDAPKPAATLSETALALGTPTERGDLGSAMRGAVGANDAPAAVSQETTSGSNARQLHPSPGAVVGALGSVLSEARACLGPDDPVRNGLVVFKSDGSVARVDLRGAKPEDDCVRAALAKAKVAPFVDDSFSTRVTVRP